jgi:hypothetical protein
VILWRKIVTRRLTISAANRRFAPFATCDSQNSLMAGDVGYALISFTTASVDGQYANICLGCFDKGMNK